MTLLRRIDQGALIPRGYGLYRVDWVTDTALLLPLGLNRVARCLWQLLLWLRFPPYEDAAFHAFVAGRKKGYAEGERWSSNLAYGRGYDEGYAHGLDDGARREWRRLEQLAGATPVPAPVTIRAAIDAAMEET